jgi:hypothetical protein
MPAAGHAALDKEDDNSMYRKSSRLMIVGCVGACTFLPTFPGYDVQVTASPEIRSTIMAIAVIPVSCPRDVNCVWIERALLDDLRQYPEFTVVSTSRVREVMLALGVETIDNAARTALADALKVDAFLVPVVGHSGTESQGAVGIWTGTTVIMTDSSVSKGSVELHLLRASDGKALLRGSGFGESEFRSGKGVVRKVFRQILREAFGSPPP